MGRKSSDIVDSVILCEREAAMKSEVDREVLSEAAGTANFKKTFDSAGKKLKAAMKDLYMANGYLRTMDRMPELIPKGYGASSIKDDIKWTNDLYNDIRDIGEELIHLASKM